MSDYINTRKSRLQDKECFFFFLNLFLYWIDGDHKWVERQGERVGKQAPD